ncbi:MAG: cytochrome c553, partial [Myxococcota bacterium]
SMRAGDRRALTPRITGDPDFSDDGAFLAVPLLLVDTAPTEDNTDTSYADEGLIPGSNRFSGAVIELPVSSGMPAPSAARLLGIRSGNSQYSPVTDFFGSYPSAAIYAPGERVLWVAMEGSRVVVTLDADVPLDDREAGDPYFELRPMAAVAVDAGPCGVAFDDGKAFAYSFLDQLVTALPVADLAEARAEHAEAALAALESEGRELEAAFDIELPEAIWLTHDPVLLDSLSRHPTTEAALDADLQTGLTLFYTANDGRMGREGADVSCTTCHAEGRNDGQTWHLTVGPRQTPSLSGQIRDTGPFTWSSDVETIADEARNTSVRRMGGVALNTNDLGRLEDFIAQLRRVRLPEAVDAEAVARGAVLFERAGCGDCHVGETLSDGAHYGILDDVAANTPTLRGVVSTAPYFHDGSAETLGEVLVASDAGLMGSTGGFTEGERGDLVAYLETL